MCHFMNAVLYKLVLKKMTSVLLVEGALCECKVDVALANSS